MQIRWEMYYNDNMVNHTNTHNTKHKVQVVKGGRYHTIKSTCDRREALKWQRSYEGLGYLARIKEVTL